MADEQATGSVLDELMKDDSIVEETLEVETDDEEIVPDSEVPLKIEDDEDSEEDKDEEETDEEESEKEDEEDEDLTDKEENELELAKIPSRKEIKAKFPTLFKEFPQLEQAFYREREYTSLFPSLSDAREAKESIEEYAGFQSELMHGNIEGVLKSVKSSDPKAFDKIAEGILDAMVRVDANSHLPTTRKITKGVLYQVNQLAKQNIKKNPEDKRAQQLEIATELLHDAIFNTVEVGLDPEQIQKEDPERTKFENERSEFEKTRFTDAFNRVSTKVNTVLTNSVTQNIDLKGILPPYVKSTVIKDVMSELDRQLVSDKPFKSLVDKLWLKAKNENYSSTAMGNLETALKNKAKSILPAIMKAKKGEAVKGLSVTKEKKEVKRELSRNTNESRTTPKEKVTLNRKDSDRLTPRPGESKLSFLMRD